RQGFATLLAPEHEGLGEPDTADLSGHDAHRRSPAQERKTAERRHRDGVEIDRGRYAGRHELLAHPRHRRLPARHESRIGESPARGILERIEHRRDRYPTPRANLERVEPEA